MRCFILRNSGQEYSLTEHRERPMPAVPPIVREPLRLGQVPIPLALLPGPAGRLHEPGVPAGRARLRRTRPGDDRPGQRPIADRGPAQGVRAGRDLRRKTARCRSRSTGIVIAEMEQAARWVEEQGASAVDINMGCPVRKVVKNGGGSALMCQADRATDLVAAVVNAVNVPVTVKMRLGWDDESLTAPEPGAGLRAGRRGRRDRPRPHARAGIHGQGQSLRNPGRRRGGRANSDRRQWRHPDHRRRGGDVRGDRLRGHLDRPRSTRQSLPLPPARLAGAEPAIPAPSRPSTNGSI